MRVFLSVFAVVFMIVRVGSDSPRDRHGRLTPGQTIAPVSDGRQSADSMEDTFTDRNSSRLVIIVENRFNCTELSRNLPNSSVGEGSAPELLLRSSRNYGNISGMLTFFLFLSISLSPF